MKAVFVVVPILLR